MKKISKEFNKRNYSILTSSDLLHSKGKDVIVCIPGNPGLCEFYTEFAAEIHKQTSMPVCVINHIGHDNPTDRKLAVLKNNEIVFNLEGQLNQKIDFITNHIDKNSKLHLIGHSIGAWMLIELLDRYDDILYKRVRSANILFPTVQRLAQTKNGSFMNNYVRKIYKILIFLCTLLQLLPTVIKNMLICMYLTLNSLPWTLSNSVSKLLNPSVLEKVLFLAFEEMDTVKELNISGMEKVKNISNFIYGRHDNWAPIEYLDEIEKYKPEVQINVVDIDHAFVLKSSEGVATMVSEFINQRKSNHQ